MPIRPPLVVIAGPTASGKSALALTLAQRAGGVIINADSAQIYRDLPILSAAPGKREIALVDHRLYCVLDGAEACSAAHWASLAREEIKRAHAAGKLPILAGGTGLYLRTLLYGIAPVPQIDAAVRDRIRAAPVSTNRAELELLDPEAARRLNPGDTTRIARALEVMLSTGRTLADWQRNPVGGIEGGFDLKPVILLPPRPWLYERCDRRFAQMVEDGAIGEVERLLSRKLDPALPVMRAIGVREIARFLSGELTRERAIAAGQQATRNYAKRQYTWFANQPPHDWPRYLDPIDADTAEAALALVTSKS